MKKVVLFFIGFAISSSVYCQSYGSVTEAVKQKALKEVEGNTVSVVGGSFDMGDSKPDGDSDTKPAHKVAVNGFLISKYDVTQSLWETVMGRNPSKFKNCPECPVEMVSWSDAQDFLSRLNKLTGKHYRLPSEAEWEYAARGGNKSKGYTFSGSNEIDSVGWCESNSGNKPHPVGQRNANELGLYDMSGNILQWCSDWYDPEYYKSSPVQNPQGPNLGKTKVLKGGAYNVYISYCRVTIRPNISPEKRYPNTGLRLVRDL
jgi:sulfatase modifying factor 1